MRSAPSLGLLLLILLATSARATGITAPGVNLAWDQCFGDGGTHNKTFACDVNTGSDRLVASFELGSDLPGVTGLEMYLDVRSTSSTVPAWWAFNAPGGVIGCRGSALLASATMPPGSVNCADWAGGLAAGGLAAYRIGSFYGPSNARVITGFAVAEPLDLVGGQEYFAMTLNLSHTKTVGTGACGGCDIPVCIFLQRINVVPGTARSVMLDRGANYSGSQYVRWQNGYPTNITPICEQLCSSPSGGLPADLFDCVLATPTSSRTSTWGQVKSLYR